MPLSKNRAKNTTANAVAMIRRGERSRWSIRRARKLARLIVNWAS